MANPMKGEALVKVSTGEFTLAFTFGTMMAIEAEFKRPTMEVLTSLSETQSIPDMVRILTLGLRKHHPDMTFDMVADLITVPEAGVWSEALGRALDDGSEPAAGGSNQPAAAEGAVRPRKATAA